MGKVTQTALKPWEKRQTLEALEQPERAARAREFHQLQRIAIVEAEAEAQAIAEALKAGETPAQSRRQCFIDLRELTEMIEAGWGDVPRDHIPPDWRTKKAPRQYALCDIPRAERHRIRMERDAQVMRERYGR
jgi:hypothetical protein